jgi:hypothetical protein
MSDVRVLNPVGNVPSSGDADLSVVTDLAGKHVVLLENTKQNARELLVGVAELLQQRHVGMTYDVRRKESASLPADPALLVDITKQADVVLTGSGD